MKYIRTKDGIYKVVLVSPLGFVRIDKRDGTFPDVFEKDIIKQADTIKELIDEYVAKKDCSRPFVIKKYEIYSNLQFGFTIYGSIWVDDNLVKVAKMNDKGELELV